MNKWIKDAIELIKPIAKKNGEHLKIRRNSLIMEDDYWSASIPLTKMSAVVKAIMRILKSELKMDEHERLALATHIWELANEKKYLKTMTYVISGDNGTWKYADSDIAENVHLMVDDTITRIDSVLIGGFNDFYKTLDEETKHDIIDEFLFKYEEEIWKIEIIDEIASWVAIELGTKIVYDYVTYRYGIGD